MRMREIRELVHSPALEPDRDRRVIARSMTCMTFAAKPGGGSGHVGYVDGGADEELTVRASGGLPQLAVPAPRAA